jgi:hypothetical protein
MAVTLFPALAWGSPELRDMRRGLFLGALASRDGVSGQLPDGRRYAQNVVCRVPKLRLRNRNWELRN